MTLSYLPVHFHLRFASPAIADNPPLFVLRSLMGMHLRSMSCVSPNMKCPDCMYKSTCAYAFLFETILQSENDVLPGRNRASHPFSFTQGDLSVGAKISEYDFTMTLFGKAVDYLPYIYAAFVRAGESGIFKNRTRFSVVDMSIGGKSILIDENHIEPNVEAEEFSFKADESGEKHGEVLVELKSPLRFKVGGKYSQDFSATDFFSALYRRAATLLKMYGAVDAELERLPKSLLSIDARNLRWKKLDHYSARQKKLVILSGAVGTFSLSGEFSCMEKKLLEFGRIANAGKNTNFGLGQMDYWTKWE